MHDFDARHCYCFASTQIKGLYQQSGFRKIPMDEVEALPKWLAASYKSMDARWRERDAGRLGLFVKRDASASTNATQIILLQHASETSKKTATGWLLDDRLCDERFQSTACNRRRLNLQLQRWTWAGRDDASKVEARLERLAESRRVHLLWTDSAGDDDAERRDESNPMPESYVILDGTWQQARRMFRRTPCLWRLPRASLRDAPPSRFVLRGDYGWRGKFGGAAADDADRDDNFLCTAEAAAAVMDRCGEPESANAIRGRLDAFQESVLPRRKTKCDEQAEDRP